MKLVELDESPSPERAAALEVFESAFTYPLGTTGRFRISHGEDYARFYRALGEARCFLVEREGRIVGAASAAIRRISVPGRGELRAAYIGDLKILDEARGGSAFLRLARAIAAWAGPRVSVGFGIVMEGTSVIPTEYTGRVGLPAFREAGRVVLFKLGPAPEGDAPWVPDPVGEKCFRELTRDRTVVHSGDPSIRSEMKARWLSDPGVACGRLEDTIRAKRLFQADGREIRAAHLACFAYASPAAGARLAIQAAGAAGFPSLFVPVPEEDADAFRREFRSLAVTEAAAVVYGTMPRSSSWCVQSSEI
ncbi:MAG TPA: GNAT family N-acetyltransferase [Planctomycetota bacterium]|nr:GNAT family N-acetyltransferase [Planctomycetota bacterium]